MPEDKPVVYVLHGDDLQAIKTQIKYFSSNLGDGDLAEMNTTRLDGKTASLNELQSAALALPFLTTRRLVIMEDALRPYSGREKQKERKEFLALLESLPQTTALVLIIPDSRKYQKGEWEVLHNTNWFVKWVRQVSPRAMIVDCALPTDDAMAGWISTKVSEQGGKFTPGAARLLAEYLGNNTQAAVLEIEKLLTYTNNERPVDEDDVRRLSIQDYQSDIFNFVDALGTRDGKAALEMLHLLLEEMDFYQLFGMIVRQFRLILLTKEILDDGGNITDVEKILKLHPYVAKKVTAQSHSFDLPGLEAVYYRLQKIDLDQKTGVMPGDIAVEVLIAELAQ